MTVTYDGAPYEVELTVDGDTMEGTYTGMRREWRHEGHAPALADCPQKGSSGASASPRRAPRS